MKKTLLFAVCFGFVGCTRLPSDRVIDVTTPPIPRPAGNDVGNGGDGVICESKGAASYDLLDFFEAQALPPKIKPELPGETLDEKVEGALARLTRLDAPKAARYREKAKDFTDDKLVRWVSGIEFYDIPDSGYVPLPGHCRIEQVAIQRKPLFPGDPRYVISKDWWENFSTDQKAGLILHEIVYEEMLSLGHVDSVRARKFTVYLASNRFSQMPQEEYATLKANLFEKSATVAFRARRFEYAFEAKDAFDLDLKELLVSAGTKLNWNWIGNAPAELSLNNGRVSWKPVDADGFKQLTFDISADDGVTGTLASFTFYILGSGHYPPRWVMNPIALRVKHSKDFTARLDQLLLARSTKHLRFVSRALPPWLEVSETGHIKGTAQQLGEYTGLVSVSDGKFKTTTQLTVYVER